MDTEVSEIAPASAGRKSWPRDAAGWIAGWIPTQRRGWLVVFAAGAGMVQRCVQVAAAFLLIPLILKALGPARFGVWGAATSLGWLNPFLDLGIGAALLTMIGEAAALNRVADARRHVTGALLAWSCLAALTLVFASAVVLLVIPAAQVSVYLIAVIGIAVNVPLNGANCFWMALQKGYMTAFWDMMQTVMMIAGTIITTWISTDVRVYVAVAYGALVLANLCSLGHLFLRHPEMRPDFRECCLEAVRRVAGKGLVYFAAGLAGGLTYLLDNVLALQLLGPEASARMAIATRICSNVMAGLILISQPLWPAFADAAARADFSWIQRTLIRGTALIIGLAAVGAAFVVAFGGPLLHWWLQVDLGIGRGLLWATAAWMVAQAAGRVPYLLLNALGVMRFQLVLCTVATSIALCLKIILAPRLGVAGILWATAVPAFFISFPALAWRDKLYLNRMRRCIS